MTFLVLYEKGRNNWGAYAPDLPGYGATAETLEELRELVREGIPFHVEGLRLSGAHVPEPTALTEAIDVA